MITLSDYWMGRDKEYATSLNDHIRENAAQTVSRANLLLMAFKDAVADWEARHVTSGWRPPQINASTPNAAVRSKHMTAEAIDIADPEGDLDDWCMAHPKELEHIGLWQEHPSATKGWCHVQIVPPKSGNRVFYP